MMIKNFVSDQTWFKEEQDPLSTMQNTGLANYFSFLVWKKVLPMDVITLGQSTTIFLCVRPFSAWWQPNDPRASLLFTSESLLQKLLKLKGDQGALWFSEWFGRGDRCCLKNKIGDFEWQAKEISPMVFDFGVALWMADRMGGWPWWGQLLGPRCTLSSVDIAPPPPPPRSSPPPSGFNVFLTLRPNIQVIHQGQVRPYTGRDGRNNKLSWSRWHLPTKRLQTCVKNTS